jgi:hypothetical protein
VDLYILSPIRLQAVMLYLFTLALRLSGHANGEDATGLRDRTAETGDSAL